MRNNLQQLQKEYLRGKEILDTVSNADNKSMEAIILRNVWKPIDLIELRNMVERYKDQGIELTIRKAD